MSKNEVLDNVRDMLEDLVGTRFTLIHPVYLAQLLSIPAKNYPKFDLIVKDLEVEVIGGEKVLKIRDALIALENIQERYADLIKVDVPKKSELKGFKEFISVHSKTDILDVLFYTIGLPLDLPFRQKEYAYSFISHYADAYSFVFSDFKRVLDHTGVFTVHNTSMIEFDRINNSDLVARYSPEKLPLTDELPELDEEQETVEEALEELFPEELFPEEQSSGQANEYSLEDIFAEGEL